MAYIVHVPNQQVLHAEGFGVVAQVPCVFGPNWGYAAEASRYLRERANSDWSRTAEQVEWFGQRGKLTRQSIRTIAYVLCNFLEWCESRPLKWEDVSYVQHVQDGFQADMLSGRWSASGTGLRPSTINLRVSEACNFLCWAAHRNLRPPFEVPLRMKRVISPSARTSHGHKPAEVQSRIGRVRPDPRTLRIPTTSEVNAWLRSVRIEKGFTKALMCELILRSGIRREEAAQWRVDTLPDHSSQWQVTGECVDVTIAYGAKGPKSRDEHGDEKGPARLINLPLALARQLARYKDTVRPRLRAKYVRDASDVREKRRRMAERCPRLFLSEFSGEPVSAQSLYDAWTTSNKLPFLGWSPHPGRHYWACMRLLEGLKQRMTALGMGRANVVMGDWITGAATDDIKLIIQPQLGHLSSETTDRYIVWLQRAFTLTEMSDLYQAHLDSFDANIDGEERFS